MEEPVSGGGALLVEFVPLDGGIAALPEAGNPALEDPALLLLANPGSELVGNCGGVEPAGNNVLGLVAALEAVFKGCAID